MQRVMLYCQYLSGMGHLVRTTQFAQALAARFEPTVIIGGPRVDGFEPPEGVEIVYLPPLWLEDGSFRVAGGNDVERVKRARREALIDLFDADRPSIVITEFFPFGRHDLLFELEPWMRHIRDTAPDTLIVSSLRDLIGKTVLSDQTDRIVDLANTYFDTVLVHSDPQFMRLEDGFVGAAQIKAPILHTGFVAQDSVSVPEPTDVPFILVSVGGGRIGANLLDTALDAARLLEAEVPHQFRVFTGPFLGDGTYDALARKARGLSNVALSRFTPKLMAHMQAADLSISLAGYNTTMNVLRSGVPAILVPIGHYDFDCEQYMRAEKLSALGAVDMLREADLSPEALASAIRQRLARETAPLQFNLDGARGATEALAALQVQGARQALPLEA